MKPIISLILAACVAVEAGADQKPNVVLILADDLAEEKNLAATHPERAKRMRARLDAWAKSVDAPEHKPNPDFKPSDK